MTSRFQRMRDLTQQIQDEITMTLEKVDGGGAAFQEDLWKKESGIGGGRTRVLRNGNVIEQGGCGWSDVLGTTLPPTILSKYPHLKGTTFKATGVSMVIHPRSPFVPTVHLNYRYFEAGQTDAEGNFVDESNNVWWFGGGMDLTPYYLDEEDCIAFHTAIKDSCDAHCAAYYPVFSAWAEKYFFIKHRKEHRGIGGLFFDYLDDRNTTSLYRAEPASFEYSPELAAFAAESCTSLPPRSFDDIFRFVSDVSRAFLPTYTRIIQRHRDRPYTDEHRQWQLYRRGRYVEFNLVYDRGTVFGLQTGGRTESILMSLPPAVRFEYQYEPKEGTPEHAMWQVNLHPRKWA